MPPPSPRLAVSHRRAQTIVLVLVLAAATFLVAAVAGGGDDPGSAEAATVRAAPAERPVTRQAGTAPTIAEDAAAAPDPYGIEWRRSTALGLPHAGALLEGVEFPREGATFFTWDPFRKTSPNPRWRRYGTDRLVRIVLTVLEEFAAANPDAPRVGVGDLSRPDGGPFYPTHRSHQNGLDVDVYYPRLDRQERPAAGPKQIDRVLAQELVDRFVAAGAEFVFVGPRTGLTGPPRIVQPLEHHDRHLHVRLPNDG